MQRGHRYMELIICDSNWVFLVLTFPGKQLIFQTENINWQHINLFSCLDDTSFSTTRHRWKHRTHSCFEYKKFCIWNFIVWFYLSLTLCPLALKTNDLNDSSNTLSRICFHWRCNVASNFDSNKLFASKFKLIIAFYNTHENTMKFCFFNCHKFELILAPHHEQIVQFLRSSGQNQREAIQ